MLVFGTQMHIVTFIFVSIEIVIFFYLLIYRLARPDDKVVSLNIFLIFLLLVYNVTGGLLPDPKLPGSYFLQEVIAYGTGFITPCYFPYYVYKAFSLDRLKFHSNKGVVIFLILPYIIFVLTFQQTGSISKSQNILVVPVIYAAWVIVSLYNAIHYKYRHYDKTKQKNQELLILLFSLTPWIGLPIITYFAIGQWAEALITNLGFLLLFCLQVLRSISEIKETHQRLLNWNYNLQDEVEKRTAELARLHKQRINTFVNLIHETKTPLTLLKNYLDLYLEGHGTNQELEVIKDSVDKLTTDVTNLFDIERLTKGSINYQHSQVLDFSSFLKSSYPLFEKYCLQRKIHCELDIEDDLFVKADSYSITRIINNIVVNAIKFTQMEGWVKIALKSNLDNIIFSVTDTGIGIAPALREKIFEPYYQINHHKTTNQQGMGLGLPIVKKLIDALDGSIEVKNPPDGSHGTRFVITLRKYLKNTEEKVMLAPERIEIAPIVKLFENSIQESTVDTCKKTILVIEDNREMLHFLAKRLSINFNVFGAINGVEALGKLNRMSLLPDIILSDVMMEQMDGFDFLKIISDRQPFSHIPIIFLTAKTIQAERLKGLKLGAIDYIYKPYSIEQLRHKIDSILNNIVKQRKATLNASIRHLKTINQSGEMIKTGSSDGNFEENCRRFQFTNREKTIAGLLLKGRTYKEIANELYISDKTVNKHVQNLFEKASVTNKVKLLNELNN